VRWVLAVLGVLSLTLGLAAPAQAASAPRATKVSTYKPWSENGTLKVRRGYRVVKTVRGKCWTGSGAAYTREDAWRCMVGNTIHDPCFVDMSAGDPGNPVLCPTGPGSKRVIRIRQAGLPLEYMNSPGPRRVWALALANGVRCEVPTGATDGPRDLRYLCTGGRFAARLNHAHRAWTVQLASLKHPRSRKTVRVVSAFR